MHTDITECQTAAIVQFLGCTQYDKTVAIVTHNSKGTPRIILLYSLIGQSFLHGTAFLVL